MLPLPCIMVDRILLKVSTCVNYIILRHATSHTSRRIGSNSFSSRYATSWSHQIARHVTPHRVKSYSVTLYSSTSLRIELFRGKSARVRSHHGYHIVSREIDMLHCVTPPRVTSHCILRHDTSRIYARELRTVDI